MSSLAPNKPVKHVGAPTPSERKAMVEAISAADERAAMRFEHAMFAASIEGTLVEKQWALHQAVENGLLRPWRGQSGDVDEEHEDPSGPYNAPPRSTLWDLLQRVEGGATDVSDFRDAPRSGRPRKELHPAVEDYIDDKLSEAVAPADRKIWLAAQRLAEDLNEVALNEGRETHPLPTYRDILTRANDKGLLSRTAARYGSREAQLKGMPHAKVPAEYVHQYWTLDAFQLPAWVLFPDIKKKRWIALKPDVIVVVDNYSTAVIAWLMVNPMRRGKTSGFDRFDIHAALVNACMRELASPGCEPYAGYLCEELRLDNASPHNPLRDPIKDLGAHVPWLPPLRPNNRGVVESTIRTLKSYCWELDGYDAAWRPKGQIQEDPRQTRTRGAARGDPERVRIICEDAELPRADEMVAKLGPAVFGLFNREHLHSTLQTTADQRYWLGFREDAASDGRELAITLKPGTARVTGDGLRYRGTDYAYESHGRALERGRVFQLREDPLRRGVWVKAFGKNDVFMPTAHEWAKTKQPADVAKAQAAAAREASDEGHEARERYRAARLVDRGLDPEAILPVPEPEVSEPPEQLSLLSSGPAEAADEDEGQAEAHEDRAAVAAAVEEGASQDAAEAKAETPTPSRPARRPSRSRKGSRPAAPPTTPDFASQARQRLSHLGLSPGA